MLTIAGIRKAYGGRTLFSEATLQVNRHDRVGLVGPNGCGKSTLFSIILGQEQADGGEISFERGVSVGHLPQESAPVADETVIELATAASTEYLKLRRTLKAWEHDHPVEAMHPEEIHDDAHHRFSELGGFRLEARAKQILAGLGFRNQDFERPAREMSGGWVMRAHLARLLAHQPGLLLLDEPTNHLDLEALLWFQDHLKTYPGAVLVISHDREFLNQLADCIVEIRQSRLIRYRGDYDHYLDQRQAQEEQFLAAYKNQQREIARLMEFVNRFRAKNTKATQAQSKLKQIERMEKIEAPGGEDRTIRFSFPQPLRSGRRVISLKGVEHAYGPVVVYRGVDFEAERGQRIVLVGPNGAGKSTLLKILAGVVAPQAGTRQLGHQVKAGYYSQYRVEMLQLDRTVLEEALDTPQRVTEEFVRTVLGCFLFAGDDVFKRVGVLSGGEKSRLALVRLLLDPPNLLLMDEPTTHLDLSSIDALLYALDQFEGTLVFISHDVYFIRSLANHVVHVNAGRLTHFPGGYDYYLDKTKAASARTGLTAAEDREPPPPASPRTGSRKEQRRREAQARQVRSRERKAQTDLVRDLELEIQALEQQQLELTTQLEKPETYQGTGRAAALNRELVSVQQRLAELNPRWEIAATRLAALEADGSQADAVPG
jgi:ATP-binding cassette subfamily F protein 3